MNCNCSKFSATLNTFQDVKERMKHTSEIKESLITLVSGGWRAIHRCKACSVLWAEESLAGARHGGGDPCFYQIHTLEPEKWLKESPHLINGLKYLEDSKKFFISLLKEEIGPEKCRVCDRFKIKHSVFCAFHHKENLSGIKFSDDVRKRYDIIRDEFLATKSDVQLPSFISGILKLIRRS
jgi:hypothetical protein